MNDEQMKTRNHQMAQLYLGRGQGGRVAQVYLEEYNHATRITFGTIAQLERFHEEITRLLVSTRHQAQGQAQCLTLRANSVGINVSITETVE